MYELRGLDVCIWVGLQLCVLYFLNLVFIGIFLYFVLLIFEQIVFLRFFVVMGCLDIFYEIFWVWLIGEDGDSEVDVGFLVDIWMLFL